MRTSFFVGAAMASCAALIALIAMAGNNEERVVFKAPFGQSKRSPGGGGTQILYNGGPVLTGTVPLYVIYYGGTSAFPINSQTIINAFLGGLGGQPQYNVNTTYCEANTTSCAGTGTSVSGPLSAGQVFHDPGSQGTNIGSSTVPKIVQNALSSGGLPISASAIYIVVTAPTIKVSGFCTSYCAFHTKATSIISGTTIHYAFAPEPSSRCTVCDGNFATFTEHVTPNGDPGADEVVDSLMHEISETVTDPDINAWFTSNGEENGDLCNFIYGSNLPKTEAGASYNATWNGFNYLIQLIWKNGPLPQGCAAAP